MKVETFDGMILSGHKQDAVEVPFDPAECWSLPTRSIRPGRRGHAVSGKLNGCALDSFIVARSGKFWLLLPDGIGELAGVSAGDVVHIELEPGD